MLREREALKKDLYLAEMANLHGKHIYWHGSTNYKNSSKPPKIDIIEPQKYGDFPCFFFTTHFGYALNYIYTDKNDLKKKDDSLKQGSVYKLHSKPFNKLAIDPNLIVGTNIWNGWIFPVTLPEGVNIFITGALGEKRRLEEIITKSEYKSFYPNEQKFLELFDKLAKEDWMFLNYEKEKYGFNRTELLNLLESTCLGSKGYAGFYGFHNFETNNKLSSIGLFKDNLNLLKIGKPLKVTYNNGYILVSKDY